MQYANNHNQTKRTFNYFILPANRAGRMFFFAFLLITLILTSCNKDENALQIPSVAETTVVIYMAAENSLSKFASDRNYRNADLNELSRAAKKIPLDCRVIVYVDDTDLPRLYSISSMTGLQLLEMKVEHNSVDVRNFEETIQEIVSTFPAKQYGLVLWSHGSGWIPQESNTGEQVSSTPTSGKPNHTFGIDNNLNLGSHDNGADNGEEMNISDMRDALKRIGIQWKYILFDACFMQCVETAYDLRNLTDYLIASPAEIPGDGAPYEAIISNLTHPTEQKIINITDAYYNNYAPASVKGGCVISVVKTSELDSLLRITKQLLPDFYNLTYDFDCTDVQGYCPFQMRSRWKPEYYDMASVMSRMLNISDYAEWYKQLKRTVIAQRYTNTWTSIYQSYTFTPIIIDNEHLALMSIFVPNDKYQSETNYNEQIKETDWYKAFTGQ